MWWLLVPRGVLLIMSGILMIVLGFFTLPTIMSGKLDRGFGIDIPALLSVIFLFIGGLGAIIYGVWDLLE